MRTKQSINIEKPVIDNQNIVLWGVIKDVVKEDIPRAVMLASTFIIAIAIIETVALIYRKIKSK